MNDIQKYQGFTMSSDYFKWGAIADGDYMVNYDGRVKSGNLKSNWAVNDRLKVPALDGINPSPYRDFNDAKTGIFLHSSNKNGWAGNYKDSKGNLHGISEGCLLIVPSRYIPGNIINGWDQFNVQLLGVSKFLLHLKRK